MASVAFWTTFASVATAAVTIGTAIQAGKGGGKAGAAPTIPAVKAPTPRKVDPKPRTVEAGETRRQSVFNRLARLRRATLVSKKKEPEPQILSRKLGAGI